MDTWTQRLYSLQDDQREFDSLCLNGIQQMISKVNSNSHFFEELCNCFRICEENISSEKAEKRLKAQQCQIQARETEMWNRTKIKVEKNQMQNLRALEEQVTNYQQQLSKLNDYHQILQSKRNKWHLSEDSNFSQKSMAYFKSDQNPQPSSNLPFSSKKFPNSGGNNGPASRSLYSERDIDFRPQEREMTIKISTFSGTVYGFTLTYLSNENKFVLKNPHKQFKGQDSLAVKNFNYLKDLDALYNDLKVIILNSNEDAFI